MSHLSERPSSVNNKQQVLTRMGRNGNPFALLVGKQIGADTVESSMEIPQKIKNRSAFWSSNSTSGNVSKGIQNTMFIAELSLITKIWKQPKYPPVDEWIKPLWDIYTMEYFLAIKKKKILPFVTVWMDLENILLSKISQSDKDKHHMISLICRI